LEQTESGVHENAHKLHAKMLELQAKKAGGGLATGEAEEMVKVTAEYHNGLRDLECFWKQKSRMQWPKDGDANSRSFHCVVVIRRNGNRIRWIMEEDIFVYEPELVNVFLNYFKKTLGC